MNLVNGQLLFNKNLLEVICCTAVFTYRHEKVYMLKYSNNMFL